MNAGTKNGDAEKAEGLMDMSRPETLSAWYWLRSMSVAALCSSSLMISVTNLHIALLLSQSTADDGLAIRCVLHDAIYSTSYDPDHVDPRSKVSG